MKTLRHIRPPARSLPALTIVAALAGGTGFLLHENTSAVPAPAQRDDARALSQSFREVARHIGPSVVGVRAIHEVEAARMSFHGGDPFKTPQGNRLRRFFGQEMPDGFELPLPTPMPVPQGQGTGVIVGEDGTIATNNHVVDGASRLMVRLQDGRELPARVIGTDPETDLAILRIDAENLPAAKLGDSDTLEPGDWVMAVGNPFGLDHSVTVGVVSAKGRSGVGVATYEDFIQTDAAINPGNSGGPLVNLDGEVVGINTAIRSSAGGSDGISFAIPSSTLESVLPQLLADGRVSRGWLGVSLQAMSPELARSFGATPGEGALVSDVIRGTPADRAGLESGDVVLSLDGAGLRGPKELSQAIAKLDPGAEIELVVLRDGERRKVEVTLGERPGRTAARSKSEDDDPSGRSPARWGLQLRDLPADLGDQLSLEHGALVQRVEPGSPAEEAGLQPGDVILSVGEHDAGSAEAAVEALRSDDAEHGVRLLVRSSEGTRWVFLEARSTE